MKDSRRSSKRLNKNKIKSLIGLATKARKVVSGEFSTEKAVRSGQAKLVVIARTRLTIRKRNFEICARITRYLSK